VIAYEEVKVDSTVFSYQGRRGVVKGRTASLAASGLAAVRVEWQDGLVEWISTSFFIVSNP
jgi:hypothetical protein